MLFFADNMNCNPGYNSFANPKDRCNYYKIQFWEHKKDINSSIILNDFVYCLQ